MSRLDDALQMLAESPPGDYWDDVGVEECEGILVALVPTEWAQLNEVLPTLPDDQLARLAYALGSVSSPQAREMLVRLIAVGRDALALGACDCLRAQLEMNGEYVIVSAQLFDYVAVLSGRCPDPWKASCERLLRHLRV
jgi:hypothetical protein